MKKKRILLRILTVLCACVLLLSVLSLSAYATEPPADDTPVSNGENGDADESSDTSGDTDTDREPNEDEPADSDGAGEIDPTADQNATEPEATEDPGDDDYERIDGGQSTETRSEHIDELDEASSEDVVIATAIPVPPAKISDASLLSGIIMWLCVAVGVAVVVGVLVSKRTRRRG